MRWRRAGGSDGNEQLTALLATVLLVLLAIEGATLLDLRALLTVHAFVGMLLIPPIVVKLASVGWRTSRYYLGAAEYVRRGPPHIVLRAVIAPVIGVSTIALFGTGVALLARDQTEGSLLALHQASFIVWIGATSLHVLGHLLELPRAVRLRASGLPARVALVGSALALGLGVATLTLPAADHLQDSATAHVGIDGD
jgi:hypothetical protein